MHRNYRKITKDYDLINETFQNQKYRNRSAADFLKSGEHLIYSYRLMFVPNAENAIVDIRKLTDYCLNPEHEIGKHKARTFEKALDLTVRDAEELKEILLDAVRTNEAQANKFDKFGQRYTIDFEIGRGTKKATVRSGWIIETDKDFPKLTTCFIL